VPPDSALTICGSDIYTASARHCEKSFSRRIVGTVVIGGMLIASTVDVLAPALFVWVERLASRHRGEVPGHANVPQLSRRKETKMTKLTTLLSGVSLTLLLSAGCAVGPNHRRSSADVPGSAVEERRKTQRSPRRNRSET